MGHLADIAVGISAISFRALGGDDRPLKDSACVRSLVRSVLAYSSVVHCGFSLLQQGTCVRGCTA